MNEYERRNFMEAIVSEVQIYNERQPNGQWIKSIKFKLPIIEDSFELSLDKKTQTECVVLLSREKS